MCQRVQFLPESMEPVAALGGLGGSSQAALGVWVQIDY
jgi:hypothetical protein